MSKTLADIKRDSDRWDALMNSGRIRILGTAGIGDKEYQHFGAEFHSTFPAHNPQENKYGKATLTTYVDTILGRLI